MIVEPPLRDQGNIGGRKTDSSSAAGKLNGRFETAFGSRCGDGWIGGEMGHELRVQSNQALQVAFRPRKRWNATDPRETVVDRKRIGRTRNSNSVQLEMRMVFLRRLKCGCNGSLQLANRNGLCGTSHWELLSFSSDPAGRSVSERSGRVCTSGPA